MILLVLILGIGTAHADRRRVVVLSFEGEKAEKFHSAVVKLVKKSHTVVSAEKWEAAAEDLSATKWNEKNIKKVAKKLKVDGVISGTIDKRRDEYIIKLKLYAGTSGSVSGSVSTKAEGPRLDGSASKDVKDELISAIGDLDSVRASGGDDDEEEKPAKKKKGDDEEEEEKPEKVAKKKKGDDEEEAKPKKGFGNGKMKKGEDEEEEEKPAKKKKGDDDEKVAKKKKGDDEEKPAKKKKGDDDEEKVAKKKGDDEENPVADEGKKRPKKKDDAEGEEVAAKGDGEGEGDGEVSAEADIGVKMEKSVALSPGNRAIDATLGLSLNARRLSWKHDADLAAGAGLGQGRPPAYKGLPAPGAVIDISAYPLAFGHKNDSITKNLGINILYDRALLISSKDVDGTKLATASQRIGVAALFRYPFGKGAKAPVVGGRFGIGKQLFEIGGMADIPDVNYTMFEPGVFIRLPVGDKLIFNADATYMLISNTGEIQGQAAYGAATVSGFDVEIGGDYSLGGALFARAAVRLESISFKFKGVGDLTTGRDADMEVDVQGAKDMYIGAALTVGYLY